VVVIHTNLHLPNQVECADVLKAGFNTHGITAHVTGSKTQAGDIHVIQGPWYCYSEWVGKPNVLWLNRCFYGCAKSIISLGWLKPDGSRDFRNQEKTECKGTLPALQPIKERRRCAVVFADYGRDMSEELALARRAYDSVWFRPHPADAQITPYLPLRGDLEAIWGLADVAVGHSSTVLVDAMINGLHVISTDPLHVTQHVTDRDDWLTKLSWAQWSLDEIRRGEFWEHLC